MIGQFSLLNNCCSRIFPIFLLLLNPSDVNQNATAGVAKMASVIIAIISLGAIADWHQQKKISYYFCFSWDSNGRGLWFVSEGQWKLAVFYM